MPILAGLDEITAATNAITAEKPRGMDTMGKDEFLKLFVTQLANQDPMEPMEDKEFIAQMAQFSSLEQLQNMNESLTESLNWTLMLSQTINNTMATSLLGRSVRVDSNSVVLGETGSTSVRFDLDKSAADVVVEITDTDGNLIRVLRQDGAAAGANEMTWDGRDAQGNRVAAGAYSINVRAEDGEGNAINARGFFTGEVDGVRYVEGQAMLTVGNVMIPLSDVIEVMATERATNDPVGAIGGDNAYDDNNG